MSKNLQKSKEEMNTFGKRLRAWRKSNSYKLVQFSKKIHVSQGSISDLENDNALPSATTLTNLCLYTEVDPCWLLTGHGPVIRKAASNNGTNDEMEEFMLLMQDKRLRKLVRTLVSTYRNGHPRKISLLEGFFAGAEFE